MLLPKMARPPPSRTGSAEISGRTGLPRAPVRACSGLTTGRQLGWSSDHVLHAAGRIATIQFHGKYDAIRQAGPSPVSVSALASVEGTENFSENFAPAFGAVVSRTMAAAAALYAVPVFVHTLAATTGVTRNTFYMGIGSLVRIGRPSTSRPRCRRGWPVMKSESRSSGSPSKTSGRPHVSAELHQRFVDDLRTSSGAAASRRVSSRFQPARKFF